ALSHRELPPSLHFRQPNPHIPFDQLPLKVQTELTPWPEVDGRALAGVSSFGFGGTNAHVVLEGLTPSAVPAATPPAAADTAWLLPLSGPSPEALQALARSWRDVLADASVSLRDGGYSAGVRRAHHDYRLALVARSNAEAVELLDTFLEGKNKPGLASGK